MSCETLLRFPQMVFILTFDSFLTAHFRKSFRTLVQRAVRPCRTNCALTVRHECNACFVWHCGRCSGLLLTRWPPYPCSLCRFLGQEISHSASFHPGKRGLPVTCNGLALHPFSNSHTPYRFLLQYLGLAAWSTEPFCFRKLYFFTLNN